MELCARYGVTLQTFYEWKGRRDSGDPRWFEERSHTTIACPHRTPGWQRAAIIQVRERFPHFGPKKVRAWLSRERPSVDWPAASTMGDILKREGLVRANPRRRRPLARGEIVSPASAPNEEWAIDLKGGGSAPTTAHAAIR